MKMKNFEPYIDWSKVTQDDANKLSKNLFKQTDAEFSLVQEASTENCINFIKTKMECMEFLRDFIDGAWTFPAMVHVAGPWGLESNPDDENQKAVIQRCANCKSIINFWHEGTMTIDESALVYVKQEDNDWWEPGSLVAKVQDDDGNYYQIENRPLKEHEIRCVGIDIFEGDS